MCTPATHTLKSDGTCGKCVFFPFCLSLFIYFSLSVPWGVGGVRVGGGGADRVEKGYLTIF